MSQSFSATTRQHGAFGLLLALAIPGQPGRRFTQQEAAIVSRALEAVTGGASSERQIYMSPIASDQDFDARVGAEGIVLTAEGFDGATLNWDQTRALKQELERFGGLRATAVDGSEKGDAAWRM